MGKKHRAIWICALILIILFALLLYINSVISPVFRDLATATVANRASSVINDAIEKQLREGEIEYDSIIFLEKDIDGNITALKTNIAQINRLKTQTLSIVDRMLLDLDVSEIGIPLGNLIVPELFSGTGPLLPIRVVSISTSEAEFSNAFSEAGINQTLHQIMLKVMIVMTVLTPVGTQNVSAESSVVVAQTVIVGRVPSSFYDWN